MPAVYDWNRWYPRAAMRRVRGNWMIWATTLALMVIGVLSITILAGRRHLRARIEAERDAIRAMGYPTTLDELVEVYGTPPPGPNGAEHFRRLPGLLVRPDEETRQHVPRFGGGKLEPCLALSEETLQATASFLATNQAYLAELRCGLAIETCHFGHDLSKAHTAVVPEVQILLHAARVLQLEGWLLLEKGDLDTACRSVVDILETAERFRRSPFLISHLVCIANTTIGLELLGALICHGALPEAGVIAISEQLRKAETWASLDDMIAAELPEYLEEVPVDPFAGGPVRYVTRGDGFAVYSVGENGADDGGTEPGDVVFAVAR